MKKVLTLALLTLVLTASSLAAQLGSLLDIEGIGPATVEKLKQAGVNTPQDLLNTGATRKGRAELSQKTGIGTSQLLKWVNRVDLSRVKGIGPQYADLLEAAGVDTPKELASRNPDHLVETLTKTNDERHLVRQVPSASQVSTWIKSAKKLKPIVEY
jgi:predicted flap endonuclease-1-like 5' DNA nuclease